MIVFYGIKFCFFSLSAKKHPTRRKKCGVCVGLARRDAFYRV